MADATVRGASERLYDDYGDVLSAFGFYYLMRYGKEMLIRDYADLWMMYIEMSVGSMAGAFTRALRLNKPTSGCTYLAGTPDEARISLLPDDKGCFSIHIETRHAREIFQDLVNHHQTGELFGLLDKIPKMSLSDKFFKFTYLVRIAWPEVDPSTVYLAGIPPADQFYTRFMREVHGTP